jgi:hypothetical protein
MESRQQAQARVDAIRAFQAELQRLEDGGVLTLSPDQRRSLAIHHAGLIAQYQTAFDVDRTAEAKQLSVGMRLASLFGALALSASVYFLFYQFWGRLGTTTQVVILVGAALGTFALTMMLRARDVSGYFTNLAAMVAFACFVLNVSMLGQIFNVTPSYVAFASWATLAFLLAYTCDSRLLLTAGMICAVVFVTAWIGTWTGAYWLSSLQRLENFFPAALILFLTPLVVAHAHRPSFPAPYRIAGLLAFLGPAIILSNWGDGSHLGLAKDSIEALYQAVGFLASVGAIALGVRRGWSEVLNIGVTFFVVFLYAKFVDWWWASMPKYLFFLLIALASVLVLFVLRRLRASAPIFTASSRMPA